MTASDDRPRLLFIAPWFLFPTISGGRIRTADILRGMLGGRFHVTLLQPEPPEGTEVHRDELVRAADEAIFWKDDSKRSSLRRLAAVASSLPISVATDDSPNARAAIRKALEQKPDVVVVDFVHTAMLCPEAFGMPSIVFTHNVEAEIYKRQAERADKPWMRTVWKSQARKMHRFEAETLKRFDAVIAVSDRDAEQFNQNFGIPHTATIPTGVDIEFHSPAKTAREGDLTDKTPELVFTGSMNWLPNIEGLEWFLAESWPKIAAACPGASLKVIGRNPDEGLVQAAKRANANWNFTGFVDDVRPHIHGGDLSIIPLRIGGGTRLKAYEAMALGSPLISTTLGVEGLPIDDGAHCLMADTADAFADACIDLLRDGEKRERIRAAARQVVVDRFSSKKVAEVFEEICLKAMGKGPAGASARAS
ncbi:Glycosyl transferases group 1 [Planctomycetes bacterium Poly30]|uniref:Glycosyl transferases group 1 n=1 Tax=Saltatorellus ferox TaxID=2528018 RepID=A0A518ELD9_9BACT|nr:Glycosyl transferases group 1 [Planctomycetes bacterium Poly30]